MLENPKIHRLSKEKIDLAWKYAYHFFFDFPKPFPWHLVRMWEDYKQHDFNSVFSSEGLLEYGESFKNLVGKPLNWTYANEEGVS